MSRLELASPTRADIIMEELYKDLERRIESSPPGLCPVDMARAFWSCVMHRLVENVYHVVLDLDS